MAQTNYTPLQLYHSTTPSQAPLAADLELGELAINVYDGKVYYKNSATGTVQLLVQAGTGAGTVSNYSFVNANGLVGVVTNPTSVPELTLSTNVTGMVKANGTAFSAAVAGTDYLAPFGSQAANLFYASPNGSSGNASFRALAVQDLPISAVTPGTYTNANITVDQYGRITLAANGSGGSSSATTLIGGTTGALPYQLLTSTTAFLDLGTTGYVLVAGASAPQYASPSTLSVGTASNLASGTAGALPYQSSAGGTSFLSLGTTGYVLTAGPTAPLYSAASSLSVGTAANLAAGTAGAVPYQSAAGTTAFVSGSTGQFLRANGTSAPTFETVNLVSLSTDNTWTGKQLFAGSASILASQFNSIGETTSVNGTALTGSDTLYANASNIRLYTANASGNWYWNIAWSSSVAFNTAIDAGTTLTVAFLTKQGATAYYCTALRIDNTPVTVSWQGGSAPIAGTANAYDVYTFTIIKTAASTYTVLGSKTSF